MKIKNFFDQLISKLPFVKKQIEKKKKAKRKKLMIILTVFFIILILLLIILIPIFVYQLVYQQKIYAGVYIDGINIGGLTRSDALNKLNRHVDNLKDRGLNFYYQNDKLNVDFTVVSPADPDLAYQILSFDPEIMTEKAFSFGRSGPLALNLWQQLISILHKKEIELEYNLDQEDLMQILETEFAEYQKPAQDAQISIGSNNQVKIIEESSGQILDFKKAIKELEENLNLITINSIELELVQQEPEITQVEAAKLIPLIKTQLNREVLVLKYGEVNWQIPNAEYKNWLGFESNQGQAQLVFLADKIKSKLAEIALEIDLPAQDAKFAMEDGKVTEFQPSKPGLELDLNNSIKKINQSFFQENEQSAELIVLESEPNIKTSELNEFGIKELVGVGVSDFTGSRNNRIKNITNASNHLNGMLIKPDEEFKLAERIGEVSAATGYFPEYVIKGDRTIPEYGGGLCQIATTTFRAALYSGLPITERKPHSYIVSYYKPIGMDAAIYGPHPDVRFINDTGHYILIQTRIEGTELTFEFWGTSDGREVEVTHPEVYNWRSPGGAKYIEKAELEPGKKILIEHARSGADAHFYRYITRPGQEKEEEIWRSHYVAWPAIYEIGIEPEAEVQESGQVEQPDNTESDSLMPAGEAPAEN